MKSIIILMCLLVYIIIKSNAKLKENGDGDTGIKSEIEKRQEKSIIKCCPRNGYIDTRYRCVRNLGNTTNGFNDVPVYDQNFQKIDKNVPEVFNFVKAKYLNFSRSHACYYGAQFNYYLIQDGKLKIELPNAYNRWVTFEHNQFCLDYALYTDDDGVLKLQHRFMAIFDVKPTSSNDILNICAQLISCFFLLLVLVVYYVLPELRRTSGLQMPYVASLFGAFLMLATLQSIIINGHKTKAICLGFSYTIYFLFLSSFSWTNVMSFEFYRTTWNYYGIAGTFRSDSTGLLNNMYAWGIPMIMTVALAFLNSVDLKHIPYFITPRIDENTCFLDGGEKLLYLYCPMMLLVFVNWLMVIFTVIVRVWNKSLNDMDFMKGNAIAEWLKLAVMTGSNWVLEVVDFFFPDCSMMCIIDVFNLLTGFHIFVIFVCKWEILTMLLNKFRNKSQNNEKLEIKQIKETPV